MALITMDDVVQLARKTGTDLLSIYLPTHRGGPEVQEGPIRLKNLLGEAERRLKERGLPAGEIVERLNPARALVEDAGFWRRQWEALALFSAPHFQRRVRLPIRVTEHCVVGNLFHVLPLLHAVEDGSEYHVLAVSLSANRLIHCTRHDSSVRVMLNAPANMEAAAAVPDQPPEELQIRSMGGTPGRGARGPAGARTAVFHGQGNEEDRHDVLIEQYLRRLEQAVSETLQSSRAPLVFAGDVSLFHAYRALNRYSGLLPSFVPGNPELYSNEQLHDEAWPLIEDRIVREKAGTVERIQTAIGNGRGSDDPIELIRAAVDSRIGTLAVYPHAPMWCRLREGARVEFVDKRASDAEDLINMTTVYTLRHGGNVVAASGAASSAMLGDFRY